MALVQARDHRFEAALEGAHFGRRAGIGGQREAALLARDRTAGGDELLERAGDASGGQPHERHRDDQREQAPAGRQRVEARHRLVHVLGGEGGMDGPARDARAWRWRRAREPARRRRCRCVSAHASRSKRVMARAIGRGPAPTRIRPSASATTAEVVGRLTTPPTAVPIADRSSAPIRTPVTSPVAETIGMLSAMTGSRASRRSTTPPERCSVRVWTARATKRSSMTRAPPMRGPPASPARASTCPAGSVSSRLVNRGRSRCSCASASAPRTASGCAGPSSLRRPAMARSADSCSATMSPTRWPTSRTRSARSALAPRSAARANRPPSPRPSRASGIAVSGTS